MNSRTLGILLALALSAACSHAPPSGEPLPSGAGLGGLFPAPASAGDSTLEIIARVRIDLPKYRVRGTVAIYRAPAGTLQIDFTSSSLFGSLREDATVLIEGDSISIEDHERGVLRGNDETLALMADYFDFEVSPRDIAVFLLLEAPRRGEMEDAVYSSSGSGWKMSGVWKGRNIEMEGEEGKGPVKLRLCRGDGSGCYEAGYRYGARSDTVSYPEKMVCEKVGGLERLSMIVESVEKIR